MQAEAAKEAQEGAANLRRQATSKADKFAQFVSQFDGDFGEIEFDE